MTHSSKGLDGCQKCNGSRGGVPGNENIVRGVKLCDYCTSDAIGTALNVWPHVCGLQGFGEPGDFCEGCRMIRGECPMCGTKVPVTSSMVLCQTCRTDGDKVHRPELRCMCNDRLDSQCPGEWEPGCDLGANEKYVRVYKQEVSADAHCYLSIAEIEVFLTEQLTPWAAGVSIPAIIEALRRKVKP